MSRQTIEDTERRIAELSPGIDRLKDTFSKVVVGQEDFRLGLLTALFCDGHVLIEGVPGLAKTLAARTLASCVSASFSRIQFTPDLLPADLTGTMVYIPEKAAFEPRKGPVFTQILLADEINRAPAKVQSALLEAMQERQVTFGGCTYPLPKPFFVMATQNPIEQEGTYPLPEAQIDRFLLKLKVDYPSQEEELEIIDRMGSSTPPVAEVVMTPSEVEEIQRLVVKIAVERSVMEYIVRIVAATRFPKQAGFSELAGLISFGASPRASLGLQAAARARAMLSGQGFVTPDQVKEVAPDVLRHRIIRSFEAEAEEVDVEEIIETILGRVPVK
ncbi:MAG: ATPase RavA [candidate division Hyd24-12 bacterium ADurb.Bin004]|nr:MAG: ATPase RavA [candidate division Hyd24-12 bacterium ADurb.Bin004]HPN62814.1 AAA family ATPase [Candidatus Fermentibacter daniensis]